MRSCSLLLILGLSACERVCPSDMTQVQGESGPFCIHTYELKVEVEQEILAKRKVLSPSPEIRSEPGLIPSNVTFDQARAICDAHGMHLCTSAEWEDACDGSPGSEPEQPGSPPAGRTYATPDGSYHTGQCGVSSMAPYFRPPEQPTGSYPDCKTPEGVVDLLGNIWEWVDPQVKDSSGAILTDKRGGAHYSSFPPPCRSHALGTHPRDFLGSTGFRCCRGLQRKISSSTGA